jgi:hypothetical protein
MSKKAPSLATLQRRRSQLEQKISKSKAHDENRSTLASASPAEPRPEKKERVNMCHQCHRSRSRAAAIRCLKKSPDGDSCESNQCTDRSETCPAIEFGREHVNRLHGGVLDAQDELERLDQLLNQRAAEADEKVGSFPRPLPRASWCAFGVCL